MFINLGEIMALKTNKCRRAFRYSIFLSVAILIMASCSLIYPQRLKYLTAENIPSWIGKYVSVDMASKIYRPYVRTEFATNGDNKILVWSISRESLYKEDWETNLNRLIGSNIIVDFDGNILDDEGANWLLNHDSGNLFPRISCPQRFQDFTQNTQLWSFSDDLKYGAKIETCAYSKGECQLQLYDMSRKSTLWTYPLKEPVIYIGRFLRWNNIECLYVVFVRKICIFSLQKGQLIYEFSCPAKESTDFEYQKKFDRDKSDQIFTDSFYATNTAFNNKKRLIACGDFYSRRVRILPIDSPKELVCELNSKDDPESPWGGLWSVSNLKFNDNGDYLIIEYRYAGRLTSKVFYPTEVYDTKTWKLCWSENSLDIQNVDVSPDGTKISFLRGDVLEIGDFVPRAVSGDACNPNLK